MPRYTERTREQSEIAWRRVDDLIESGATYEELTDRLGYAGRQYMEQAHAHRGVLPTAKRDAIATAHAEQEARSNGILAASEIAQVPGGTTWDDVREAAARLEEALREASAQIPAGLVSDRLTAWINAASDIHEGLS